ncbi:MAG: hypothetical protein WKG01_28400 [Kofleriaceae bacterium]
MKKLVIVAFVVALAACGGKKKNDTMNTTDTSGSGSAEMGSGDMGSGDMGSGDGSATPEGGAGSGM